VPARCCLRPGATRFVIHVRVEQARADRRIEQDKSPYRAWFSLQEFERLRRAAAPSPIRPCNPRRLPFPSGAEAGDFLAACAAVDGKSCSRALRTFTPEASQSDITISDHDGCLQPRTGALLRLVGTLIALLALSWCRWCSDELDSLRQQPLIAVEKTQNF
jgi:hypothetical protein